MNEVLSEHNIRIIGFKADIIDVSKILLKVDNIGPEGTIQILRVEGLAGKIHIRHAANQAILSFQRKTNFAQDLGLEICLRASGQRQISRALKILGIKNGKQNLCAVLIDCPQEYVLKLEEILGPRDDSVLHPQFTTLQKIYKISGTEIDAYNGVKNVLIEKTTLLDLEN